MKNLQKTVEEKYYVVKDGDVVFHGTESECVEIIENDMTGCFEMYPESARLKH